MRAESLRRLRVDVLGADFPESQRALGCGDGHLFVELSELLGLAQAAAGVGDHDADRDEQAAVETGAPTQHCKGVEILRVDETLAEFPQATGRRLLFDTIRRMLSQQVYDVIDATRAKLAEHQPADADEARRCPPLVRFSPEMREASTQLKSFLFKELYRHPQVNETTARAKQVLTELFQAYVAAPSEMKAAYAQREDRHRAVADYISGMTDRFAVREHERLTGQRIF